MSSIILVGMAIDVLVGLLGASVVIRFQRPWTAALALTGGVRS